MIDLLDRLKEKAEYQSEYVQCPIGMMPYNEDLEAEIHEKEYRWLRYWDSGVEGLVITRAQSELWDQLFGGENGVDLEPEIPTNIAWWTVTHYDSGKNATGKVFVTFDQAVTCAKKIASITDWTQDETAIKSENAHRQAAMIAGELQRQWYVT